jgi:ATP-dependent Clp protease protease subunit
VLPHARVVLQQPGQGGTRGDVPDLQVAAKEIGRLREEMEAILATHTGRAVSQVHSDTERDRVLRAPEAVSYGLADAVLDSRKLVTV